MNSKTSAAPASLSSAKTIEAQQDSAADAALADYDFGDGAAVVGRDGWSHEMNDGLVDWTCAVYVTYDDQPADADSEKASFHAKFLPGSATVVEAYAYDMRTGSEIGRPFVAPVSMAA